jgi:Holliday junction resolvase
MSTKKPPLESRVVKKIMTALNERGGFWFKSHGFAFQLIGLPDIIGCYRGRFVAFEVKRSADEELTPRQAYCISRIRKAGGVALRIHSVEMAIAILDRIDERREAKRSGS